METRKIAIIVAFAALTIALNAIRIPAVYLPGFYYQFYEIPIVVAFFLFGLETGTLVAFLNLLGEMVFFPIPVGIVAYPFGFLAVLIMILGIYLAGMLVKRRLQQGNTLSRNRIIVYLTALGTVSRTVVMPILDFGLLYHYLIPFIIGRNFAESYLITLVPGMVILNATVALYTIPLSYLIAKKVAENLKTHETLKTRFEPPLQRI